MPTEYDIATQNEQELEQLFSAIGQLIVESFPEDDLRLSRLEGSDLLTIHAPEHNDDPAEIALLAVDPEQLVYEALFSVKQLLRRFDA